MKRVRGLQATCGLQARNSIPSSKGSLITTTSETSTSVHLRELEVVRRESQCEASVSGFRCHYRWCMHKLQRMPQHSWTGERKPFMNDLLMSAWDAPPKKTMLGPCRPPSHVPFMLSSCTSVRLHALFSTALGIGNLCTPTA